MRLSSAAARIAARRSARTEALWRPCLTALPFPGWPPRFRLFVVIYVRLCRFSARLFIPTPTEACDASARTQPADGLRRPPALDCLRTTITARRRPGAGRIALLQSPHWSFCSQCRSIPGKSIDISPAETTGRSSTAFAYRNNFA